LDRSPGERRTSNIELPTPKYLAAQIPLFSEPPISHLRTSIFHLPSSIFDRNPQSAIRAASPDHRGIERPRPTDDDLIHPAEG